MPADRRPDAAQAAAQATQGPQETQEHQESLDTPTMHIGELAERADLSLRTIRHYGDVGLLPPRERTASGYRLFDEDDLQKLLRIKHLRQLEFGLDEIAALLPVFEGGPFDEETRALARQTAERLEREHARLIDRAARAEVFVEELRRRLAD